MKTEKKFPTEKYQSQENNQGESMAKKKASRKGSALQKPVKISSKLAAVIGKGPMPRSQVMKKIWAYIKRNDLQHEKNKRCIELDEKLKTILKPTKGPIKMRGKSIKIPAGCVFMTDLSKQLNKHIESAKVKVNPRGYDYEYEDDEDEDEDDYDTYSNPDYDDEDDDDDYDTYSNPYEDDEDDEDDEDYEDDDY